MAVDKVARQFGRQWNEPRCPVCDGTKWKGGDALAYVLVVQETGDDPVLEGGGAEAVPMICQSCGFIRLHDMATLRG